MIFEEGNHLPDLFPCGDFRIGQGPGAGRIVQDDAGGVEMHHVGLKHVEVQHVLARVGDLAARLRLVIKLVDALIGGHFCAVHAAHAEAQGHGLALAVLVAALLPRAAAQVRHVRIARAVDEGIRRHELDAALVGHAHGHHAVALDVYLLDDGVQQQLHARLQAHALEHDLHAFGVEIAAVFRQTAHLFQLVQDFFKNAEDELPALFRRNALLPVGHKGVD